MNNFFTADLHLNHRAIIQYCNRPFPDVNTMNRQILENWNSVVQPEDRVYVVGDIGFGDLRTLLDRLNGHIILIEGGHDRRVVNQCRSRFSAVVPLLDINIGEQSITLCHYALRVWNKSHWGSYHLYGHSHGKLEGIGKSMDVGVDTHNYFPYSWDEIKGIMVGKSDNPNLVKRDK